MGASAWCYKRGFFTMKNRDASDNWIKDRFFVEKNFFEKNNCPRNYG
jgi:hypothetical protein